MKTKKAREAAVKYFNDPRPFGSLFMNFMEYGHEVDIDTGCSYDVLSECPDDVRHARSISAKQYAELMRANIINYLSTPAGLRDLRVVTDQMHEELTEAGEDGDDD